MATSLNVTDLCDMAPRARRPGPELAGGAPGLGPEPSGKGGEGARGPGGPDPGRPAPRASSADGEPDLLAPRGHRTPGWPFRRAGGQLPGSESSHRHRPPSGAPAPPTAPDRRTPHCGPHPEDRSSVSGIVPSEPHPGAGFGPHETTLPREDRGCLSATTTPSLPRGHAA